MSSLSDVRRKIARIRARIEKREQQNEADLKEIHIWEAAMTELEAQGAEQPLPLQPLNERSEKINVFSEHMTATTLRERNRAISDAKGKTPLAKACRAAGWQSKNEFAKKVGRSPGSLVAYENGRKIPAAVLRKVKALTKSKLHPDGFANFPNIEE